MSLTEIEKKVLSKIDENKIVETLKELIRIPSITGDEGELAYYVEGIMRELGMETEKEEFHYKRPNVYGTLKGTGGGKNLLVYSHSDTEPPVIGQKHPFSPEVKNGSVYGLGAGDSHPGIAAVLGAIEAIKKAGVKLKGNIIYTLLVEELTYSRGVGLFCKTMKKKGIKADMMLIAEPTGLNLSVFNTGIVECLIETKGRAGHPVIPGINAVLKMTEVIDALQKWLPQDPILQVEHQSPVKPFKTKLFPWTGKPTWYIGAIDGGFTQGPASPRTETGTINLGTYSWDTAHIPGPGGAALMPEYCRLRVGFRTFPKPLKDGERWSVGPREEHKTEKVIKAIDNAVKKAKEKDPELDYKVILYRDLNAPGEISTNEEIAQVIKKAAKKLTGSEPPIVFTNWWVEGGVFFMHGIDMPYAQYGTGYDIIRPEEHCPINELITSAKVYALAIMDACGVKA